MDSRTQACFLIAAALTIAACERKSGTLTSRGSISPRPRVAISEIMANPRAVPDERGEWLELQNLEPRAVDLRGWTIGSQNDRGITIERSVVIPPDGFVVLARDGDQTANGGVTAAYAYRDGLTLGNSSDWVALHSADGSTVDSVGWSSTIAGASRALSDGAAASHADVMGPAWITATTAYGKGDFGTPGRANGAIAADSRARAASPASTAGEPIASGKATRDSTLIVHVLDVGQGDAILIENGDSRVLIDGGPEPSRFARLLDRFGLSGSTIDAVILTHQHYDHYAGLRELFRASRRITVRYVFENQDPSSNASLARLRDSIIARAKRGTLDYRDTDDPCGTGAPECTITLRGGARVHLLRPDPRGEGPNNRSAVVKLVAPDSAAFTMWLAGDAERQEIAWFDATDYDRSPGMRATVLKGDHHGSCDGISPRYLDLVRPEAVVLSLAAENDYGYVHSQTLDLLQARRIPWYRTDQNGTITITVPRHGARYSVSVGLGGPGMRGPTDRPARHCGDEEAGGRRR
jgi:competence protein ComEC